MAEAQFSPAAPVGHSTNAAFSGIDFGTSMMERASRMRDAEQMQEMRRLQIAQEVAMIPLRQAEIGARTAKATTDYQSALNMQRTMENMYPMAQKARDDFNFINQIENSSARAKASVEWLSRYQQLTNIKDLQEEFDTFSKLAAKNVSAFATIRSAEELFFNNLTEGMTPDEVAKAKRVKVGLDARPSGAAIQYKEVVGPDGSTRLVAVDPRSVGAQIVDSGETFGSGVNQTPESQARVAGAQPASSSLTSQTAQEEAKAKEAGKAEAEYTAKLKTEKPKRSASIQQAGKLTEQLTTDIDSLITKVNAATAGPGGVVLDKFPGTTARDLQANLDSIKANIGFQALQAMREASPTGGALGQVSDAENRLLQARFGALEIGQSPTQLIENLKKVRQRIVENYGITRSAFETQYGEEVGANSGEVKEIGKFKVRVK